MSLIPLTMTTFMKERRFMQQILDKIIAVVETKKNQDEAQKTCLIKSHRFQHQNVMYLHVRTYLYHILNHYKIMVNYDYYFNGQRNALEIVETTMLQVAKYLVIPKNFVKNTFDVKGTNMNGVNLNEKTRNHYHSTRVEYFTCHDGDPKWSYASPKRIFDSITPASEKELYHLQLQCNDLLIGFLRESETYVDLWIIMTITNMVIERVKYADTHPLMVTQHQSCVSLTISSLLDFVTSC
jgi:hypothetical protein